MLTVCSMGLTPQQIADYEELGFVPSIGVLTSEEVRYYRARLEETWVRLGTRVTRADGLHLYFDWAWALATHPRLLDCLEELLGPNIVLKHTRVLYKRAGSGAWVGWHQDGFTERLSDRCAPAVWMGLTDATVENGCLRVVPHSHRNGLLPHFSRVDRDDLAHSHAGTASPASLLDSNGLSVTMTSAPTGLEPPYDVEMRAGQMSFHHPLLLHGSNPNRSAEPRIGLSATFATFESQKAGVPVALARGAFATGQSFQIISPPPARPLEDAVAAYLASGRQILCEI